MREPRLLQSAAAVVLSLALGIAVVALAQRPEPKKRMLAGDTLYEVLPKDAIPAIDDPAPIPLAEAGERAAPDEPFLGVVVNGEARAYSTWLLEHHELVNDVVGGVPIAACW